MMMPENAGGMQQAMTSMDRLSVSIPQSAPAMQMASGERKSLKTVFQIISALDAERHSGKRKARRKNRDARVGFRDEFK